MVRQAHHERLYVLILMNCLASSKSPPLYLFPFAIGRMQEVMRFLTERNIKELGINLLDFWVIVRFAQLLASVFLVNGTDA